MTRDPKHLDDAAEGIRKLRFHWDEERFLRGHRDLEARYQRKQTQRRTAYAAALSLCAGVATGYLGDIPQAGRQDASPSSRAPFAAAGHSTGERIVLNNGSSVFLGKGKALLVQDDMWGSALEMEEGTVRFSVEPLRSRYFRIKAGATHVAVVGTDFDIRLENGAVGIRVREGVVGVASSKQGEEREESFARNSSLLRANTTWVWFLDPDFETSMGASGGGSQVVSQESLRDSKSSWRTLARKRSYDEAWQELQDGGTVRDRVDELLQASDVARKSGHAKASIPYLTRILKNHSKDNRAAIAAFTLAKVKQSLKDYLGAAKAFHKTQTLGPSSNVAESALAREAMCLASAGRRGAAHRRAQLYLKKFPNGSYAPEMKQIQ